MALSLQSTYKLVSGYEIPVVGFGVSTAAIEKSQLITDGVSAGLPNVRLPLHVISTAETNSYLNRPPDVTTKVTIKAIELGYRHVRKHSKSHTKTFQLTVII
jgi:diketogulonate reductase-like aldo/keto reductase